MGANPAVVARDACSSESVRNGLCVHSEMAGDLGKRRSGYMQLRRGVEDLVVPCGLLAVARDTVAVKVAGHGGSVDAELDAEFLDGDAGPAGINEVVDVGGGEASLGRV